MPFGVAVCIARLIEVDTDTGKMHDSALDRDHKGGRGKLPPAFEPLRVSPDPLKRGIPPQRTLRTWINSSACGPAVTDMMHRHRPPEAPRSGERRVGKACVSTSRSRWWTDTSK